MRIIIELDSQGSQPSVQVQGGNDTAVNAPTVVNAIDAGGAAPTGKIGTEFGVQSTVESSASIPDSVKAGATSAGEAPVNGESDSENTLVMNY